MCPREKEREKDSTKTEGLNDDLLNCMGSYNISSVLNRYPASISSKVLSP